MVLGNVSGGYVLHIRTTTWCTSTTTSAPVTCCGPRASCRWVRWS
ncbi:hypothetical protein V2I01_06335 [Micromonospora sp. BRA006-A]|nr:hypothetical protein [Micromonospora sp. BRA006-A]